MEIKNRQKIKETIKLQGFMLTIFWLIVLPLTISAKEIGWAVLLISMPILFILFLVFLFILINLAFFKEEEIKNIYTNKTSFLNNKIISFICYFFFIFSLCIPHILVPIAILSLLTIGISTIIITLIKNN